MPHDLTRRIDRLRAQIADATPQLQRDQRQQRWDIFNALSAEEKEEAHHLALGMVAAAARARTPDEQATSETFIRQKAHFYTWYREHGMPLEDE